MTQKSLDRETVDRFTLVVEAKDQGKPSLNSNATLDVIVLDVNDNALSFAASSYATTVREETSSTAGQLLITVTATDADEGTNADITFSIGNNNPNGLFYVTSAGQLYSTGTFDREEKTSYTFDVIATDRGSPSLSASTKSTTSTTSTTSTPSTPSTTSTTSTTIVSRIQTVGRSNARSAYRRSHPDPQSGPNCFT